MDKIILIWETSVVWGNGKTEASVCHRPGTGTTSAVEEFLVAENHAAMLDGTHHKVTFSSLPQNSLIKNQAVWIMKPILKASPGEAERYKDISRGEQQILLFKTPVTRPKLYFSKRKKKIKW